MTFGKLKKATLFFCYTSRVTLTSVSIKHQLEQPYSTNVDTHLGKNTLKMHRGI